jgi:hypothetical protein
MHWCACHHQRAPDHSVRMLREGSSVGFRGSQVGWGSTLSARALVSSMESFPRCRCFSTACSTMRRAFNSTCWGGKEWGGADRG